MLNARRPLLAAAVMAGLLSGCAQSSSDDDVDFKGEQKLVANVVDDLTDAGRDKDGDAVCGLLAAELIKKIRATAGGKASCAEAVDDALDDADSFRIHVKSVKIDGTSATAVVESEENDDEIRDTLSFVKESSRWKLSALAG
jgi:hypothetical protein